jgi:hypothetical protein
MYSANLQKSNFYFDNKHILIFGPEANGRLTDLQSDHSGSTPAVSTKVSSLLTTDEVLIHVPPEITKRREKLWSYEPHWPGNCTVTALK